ncbi:helix-hairpin-helix domain-containing protein [bacterium 210917-DFI.7.65]|nr:helix-hairpin-helix domain-containing protein [bacterium 210917-DFI.7.65]
MKVSEKVTKTEALLLAMTLVFLLLTGAIFVLRSRSGGAEYVVRNETMRAAAEETPPASVLEEEPPVPSAENPLNINMADAAALDTLPGIGPVLAGRIVEYRSTHGAFSKKEDLMLVEGIGEGIYGDLRDVITVEEAAE